MYVAACVLIAKLIENEFGWLLKTYEKCSPIALEQNHN